MKYLKLFIDSLKDQRLASDQKYTLIGLAFLKQTNGASLEEVSKAVCIDHDYLKDVMVGKFELTPYMTKKLATFFLKPLMKSNC